MNKVQLTLTKEEAEILGLKAATLGYDVTKYIKFLISREAFTFMENIPTFPLSKKAEKQAKKAIEDDKQGKSIPLAQLHNLD